MKLKRELDAAERVAETATVLLAGSLKFDGTLTLNRLLAYWIERGEGGSTRPEGGVPPAAPAEAERVASAVVGARGSRFR